MPIEILMPALSPTMTEGNLSKWLKKEGDDVAAGDVIAEIETDKATMEVEAVDEGKIGRIVIKEGTKNVKVNELIAIILEEGEDKSAIDKFLKGKEEEKKKQAAEKPKTATAEKSDTTAATVQLPAGSGLTPPPAPPVFKTSTSAKSFSGERTKISPLAKRMAEKAGINIASITGTGPHGRIVEHDVENSIKSGGMASVVTRNPVEAVKIENDNMRQVIAQRLLQSKQHVPHFYLTIECNIDKLLALREDLNGEASNLESTGKPAYKLSVNDMVIKAVAKSLKKIPAANASWTEKEIIFYNNVDVSVAVAIDGGLITPIIRNADQKSLPQISNEMKSLADKARKGKLQPEEFQGGGFSISNLGMYGIKNFSAIINPPQSCILAVGAGEKRPVIIGDKIEIANIMSVTLSCDHRVVDGAIGAEFLSAFKGFIEKPVTLII